MGPLFDIGGDSGGDTGGGDVHESIVHSSCSLTSETFELLIVSSESVLVDAVSPASPADDGVGDRAASGPHWHGMAMTSEGLICLEGAWHGKA